MKLSKILLITLLVFSISLNLKSIENKGFKLGLNLSTLTNQDKIDPELSPNISMGILINSKINNRISFQPELRFMLRRITFDGRVEQNIDND
ncbi:MAG: PorT family protein [Candidatus Cloacimonetes bacterium]|nr:PorT family protein [Candidatus Cloacimonadota bacterium]